MKAENKEHGDHPIETGRKIFDCCMGDMGLKGVCWLQEEPVQQDKESLVQEQMDSVPQLDSSET